jgi:hypothetical protein
MEGQDALLTLLATSTFNTRAVLGSAEGTAFWQAASTVGGAACCRTRVRCTRQCMQGLVVAQLPYYLSHYFFKL